METFSALLALCVDNSPVTSEFPVQRTMTRSFDVFFHLCLNKWLSKHSWGWWIETPSRPLWRHCNESNIAIGSQIAKSIGSTSTEHRSHTFAADWCLINVDPGVFAFFIRRVWVQTIGINMAFGSDQTDQKGSRLMSGCGEAQTSVEMTWETRCYTTGMTGAFYDCHGRR